MSAPTQWILGDAESSDAFLRAKNAPNIGNAQTRAAALYRGGYMLQDRAKIDFLDGYTRSTYAKCAQCFTWGRSAGGTYTPRAIFKLPKLEETTSWLTIDSTQIAAVLAHFSLTPAGAGVLAIYVAFFGQRYTRRHGPKHSPPPWHIYPTNTDANSIAIAMSARFA